MPHCAQAYDWEKITSRRGSETSVSLPAASIEISPALSSFFGLVSPLSFFLVPFVFFFWLASCNPSWDDSPAREADDSLSDDLGTIGEISMVPSP